MAPEWEIIGVVKDVCARPDQPPPPILYRPYWLLDVPNVIVVVGTWGEPLSVAAQSERRFTKWMRLCRSRIFGPCATFWSNRWPDGTSKC